MPELTPVLMGELWRMASESKQHDDGFLASIQKYMVLHEDMHDTWDKLAVDPATPVVVDGTNLLVHIAMDCSTERSLQENQPPGVQELYQTLKVAGLEDGDAFHVIEQALEHEFLIAAEGGGEMDLVKFMERAKGYVAKAIEGKKSV